MLRLCCFYISTILLTIGLAACSSGGKKWNPDDYTVKSGDTVYSIAWRYEIDPEEFSEWNKIRSNVIRPGQRLHTRKPYNFVSTSKSESSYSGRVAYAPKKPSASRNSAGKGYANKKWVKAVNGDSLSKISQRTGVSVERLAKLNQLKRPYVIHPGQTIFLKPLDSSNKTRSKSVTKKSATSTRSTKRKESTKQIKTLKWPRTVKWKRPTKGKVVKKFNRSRNDAKGVEYKGKRGDSIVAAADGKVVYSGSGLINYGNLVIIKHNKTYLSAYAYNRKLLVSEGDLVKAGQKVAEMGNKDKQTPRLHFEIRKNGKPVDPQKYLPW